MTYMLRIIITNIIQTKYDYQQIIYITTKLNNYIMQTLYPSQIAKQHLSKLGLKDLTSYSPQQKKEFWAKVEAEYISQYTK